MERPPLGVHRQTLRCWEHGYVAFGAARESATESIDPAFGVQVVSAFFGDPKDPKFRKDITCQVHDFLQAELEYAGGKDGKVEVPAIVRLWGDPAKFRVKQLEVTYEYAWLGREERAAIEALERRVSEKAQSAPDLEELLVRLGAALGEAACSRTEARGVTSQIASQAATELNAQQSGGNSGEQSSAPLGATSPRWKLLGFQSNDPRTDLRTGRLALESLVYLAERYPLATGQMVREAQSDGIDYPFAVASINVTQLLAKYFGLAGETSSCGAGGAGGRSAPRRVVQALARMTAREAAGKSGVDPFGELHAAVVSRLHATWRHRKQANSNLTVMDFAPALEECIAAVHAFCLGAPLESPAEFRCLPGPGEFSSALTNAPQSLARPAGTELCSLQAREVIAARVAAAEAENATPYGDGTPTGAAPEDTVAVLQRSFSSVSETAGRSFTSVSETAGIFGAYLQGVIHETAAAVASAVPPAAEDLQELSPTSRGGID